MALTVTRHGGESFSELAIAWGALLDPAQLGAPFRSFAWISAWWRVAPPRAEACILVAREAAEIVAILPLWGEPTRLGGVRLRVMADDIVGSDYVGIVARPAHEARAARAFSDWLVGSAADEVYLDGLVEDDPLVRELASREGVSVATRYRCPTIQITGEYEQYLSSLAGGTGSQWRRRSRWLERQKGFAIEEVSAPEEVVRALGPLLRLHQDRWALDGGSEAIDGPRVERFHLDAANGLARLGFARVWLLHVEGAPRAALYGFLHGTRLAYYQGGHDPEWRPRSVGTVLLGHVIARCFAGGVTEFDFLRGSEGYKSSWATGSRRTVAARLVGSTARARLGQGGNETWTFLRDAVKATLPPRALALLRRTRLRMARRRWGPR